MAVVRTVVWLVAAVSAFFLLEITLRTVQSLLAQGGLTIAAIIVVLVTSMLSCALVMVARTVIKFIEAHNQADSGDYKD